MRYIKIVGIILLAVFLVLLCVGIIKERAYEKLVEQIETNLRRLQLGMSKEQVSTIVGHPLDYKEDQRVRVREFVRGYGFGGWRLEQWTYPYSLRSMYWGNTCIFDEVSGRLIFVEIGARGEGDTARYLMAEESYKLLSSIRRNMTCDEVADRAGEPAGIEDYSWRDKNFKIWHYPPKSDLGRPVYCAFDISTGKVAGVRIDTDFAKDWEDQGRREKEFQKRLAEHSHLFEED